jgi:beta-1,4-N-acetylglucosaminyltransferase
MIFLTVGTQFPFDRLVKAVDDLLDGDLTIEEIFAQIGNSSYRPRNFEAVSSLEKHLFDRHFCEASSVIGHAGIGTVSMAMEHEKPLLVVPRRQKYGEVVNDHQVAIAERFERLGHLLVAYETRDLPAKIDQLRTFVPRKRDACPKAVAKRIACFLNQLIACDAQTNHQRIQCRGYHTCR